MKSQKATVTDTVAKASQKTVFDQNLSTWRLVDGNSTVTQQWNPITLRNPEDGGDTFSETSDLTTAARYEVPEVINNPIDVFVHKDRLCGLVVRGPGYRPRGPAFISKRYQIFWVLLACNWVHSVPWE
jgi:hypothetical protein